MRTRRGYYITHPNERKSLMSCIISLRLRAYSVDEMSTACALSSKEDWLPVSIEATEGTVAVEVTEGSIAIEVTEGETVRLPDRFPSKRFIGIDERSKRK